MKMFTEQRPYYVEEDSPPCSKCGKGNLYNVVNGITDIATSTLYSEKDEAEEISVELNDTYEEGFLAGVEYEKSKAITKTKVNERNSKRRKPSVR